MRGRRLDDGAVQRRRHHHHDGVHVGSAIKSGSRRMLDSEGGGLLPGGGEIAARQPDQAAVGEIACEVLRVTRTVLPPPIRPNPNGVMSNVQDGCVAEPAGVYGTVAGVVKARMGGDVRAGRVRRCAAHRASI